MFKPNGHGNEDTMEGVVGSKKCLPWAIPLLMDVFGPIEFRVEAHISMEDMRTKVIQLPLRTAIHPRDHGDLKGQKTGQAMLLNVAMHAFTHSCQ